jgi:chromosome segregation ATPase
MKFTSCALVLIGILGITPVCHAGKSTDTTSIEAVKQETRDLLQTLDAYTADRKDEAIRKTKTALDNLDKRIEALEARVDESWDKMDKAAREKARESLKALREQRNRVAEWYGSLKSSTIDSWEHIKKGFSNAYKTLDDAWEKSEKEFGANP